MMKLSCGFNYTRDNLLITWPDFNKEIFSQYGSSKFEDHFEELSKFRQTSTVQEYYKGFIRLVTKAGNVTVPQQISFFVGGLKQTIRVDVKGQKPQTLASTLSYAKFYESSVTELRLLRKSGGTYRGNDSTKVLSTCSTETVGRFHKV